MSKFLATFGLTYKNKIKTKAFMIFTVIVILLMILGANINKIVDLFDGGNDKIGVVTNNEQIYKTLKSQGSKLYDDASFKKVSDKKAHRLVKNEKLDRAYMIKIKDKNQLSAKILSRDTVSNEDKQKLKSVLTTMQTQIVAHDLKLSPQDLKQLQSHSAVDSEVITKHGKQSQLNASEKGFNMIIIYIGVMLMFFIILNYGNQVAMEIATEKTSRVIEMIITSVSPIKHLFAKVLGVVSVALTQILIFIVAGLICFFVFDIKKMLKGFKLEPNGLTLQIAIVGIISLILGILTYVFLAAILGSITARIEDISQTLMPMTLLSMIAFYIALYSLMQSETIFTKVASFIPFVSPFVMFVRASSPDVAIWEFILSFLLSIITIIILVWLAVRSYKDSILNFDQSFFKSMRRIFKKS